MGTVGTVLLVIFGVVIAIVVIAALWGVGAYNNFVKQRNIIQESWRQIDVELNRRYELIPNLVETVRGFAAHERNTLEEVTRLRNQAAALAGQGGSAPSAQRADIESQLSGAVRNLIVTVEAYPQIQSNQNFLELQRELTETEDRIAAGRRFYNANVRAYNTSVETFPSVFIANMFHFEKATYFEVNDPAARVAPTVNFGSISDRGDPQRINEPSRDRLPASDPNALPNPQGYQQPYQQPAVDPAATTYQQPAYQPQPYQPPAQQQYQPPAQPYQAPTQPPAQPYQPPASGPYQPPQ